MRISAISILLLISAMAFASPARDRAQAVMDGLQGSVVSATVGGDVLDAFIASPRFEAHVPMVLVGEDFVPKTSWTVEEKSQFFLDRVKSFTLTIRNKHKISLKRTQLKPSQDVIEDEVAAEVIADL